MKELEKKYNSSESEKKWQQYWQDNKIFQFNWDERNKDKIFSIDTPPPHVSGVLHMGHIFGYTQMDAIARFERMNGKNVFFPIGFDDNGLPSERYVEKKINKQSKSMERSEFVNICDKEIVEVESVMEDLFKSAGFSFDLDSKYRTISPMSRKISQMSFIDLYKKGHIYRKEEPVIWDVISQTALAQTELDDTNLKSQMNFINFTLIDKNTKQEDNLEIMTTRPELLPACVAIFCHPDNFEKYRNKEVKTPLGAIVPILADESVEKEKGTGVMMCCTFGDQADVEKWKKYKLDLKIILDEKGCLKLDNIVIDNEYKTELNGLFVEKARKKILELLEKNGKIAKEPVLIEHPVKIGDRTKYPVEILIKKQWFIDVLSIKDELHKKASEIKWQPAYMEARIHNWIDGLSWDWCISRQRFFGVPIPVWYSKKSGEEGKVILPDVKNLPVDPTATLPDGYAKDEVECEYDVFDTWATSALSPQLSTHYINEEYNAGDDREKSISLPFDLRFQGHDIIRTWAFCTIAKAYYHQNIIPWKNILINGFCLSEDGTKMSKSIGNVINPVKVMKEFGSDALRYWATNSILGTDTNYSTEVLKMGQKLVTKLFNASKFAELHFKKLVDKNFDIKKDLQDKTIFKTIDLWLISRLKKVVDEYMTASNDFNYNKALNTVENFFWNDLCDNYLEIVKIRCYGIDATKYKDINLSDGEKEEITKEQQSAIKTIYYTLNTVLKLFAPFIPTITEEIFSCLYEDEFNSIKSIHARNSFKNIFDFVENNECENMGNDVLKILFDIRKFKSDKNISIKEMIDTVEVSSKYDLNDVLDDLKNVCNVNTFFVIKNDEYKLEIK